MKTYTQILVLACLFFIFSYNLLAQSESFEHYKDLELFDCQIILSEDLIQYPPRIESLPFYADKFKEVASFSQNVIAKEGQVYTFNGIISMPESRKGIQSINKFQGLPDNFVFDLVTDEARNIWMHLDLIGLVQFDGHKFNAFTKDEGLVSDDIISLQEQADGIGVWVLSKYGISNFDGIFFKNWYFEDVIDKHAIRSTTTQGDTLWIGTRDDGLWCVLDGAIKKYDVDSGLRSNGIQSLYLDKNNKLWLTYSDGGVDYIEGDKIHRMYFNEKSMEPLIIGDFQNGFYIYDKKAKRLKNFVSGVLYETNLDVEGELLDFQLTKNGIWFITKDSGIFSFDNKTFCRYYSNKDMPANRVTCSTVVDDQIWLGCLGAGLQIIRSLDYTFLEYDKDSFDPLSATFFSTNGHLYFAALDAIYRLKPGTTILEKQKCSALDPLRFLSFTEDNKGAVWCSTLDGVLYKEVDGVFVEKEDFRSKNISDIFDIGFDSDGVLWMASYYNKVYSVQPDGQIETIEIDSDRQVLILDIELDNEGKLWVATSNGLFRQDNGDFKKYDLTNFPIENIYSIFKDSKGRLWIGAKRGIAFYDGSEFKFINRYSGLLSNVVVAISEDSKGRIWLVTEVGLNILDHVDHWEKMKITSFTYEEGFNELDYYPGAGQFDADDVLWLVSLNGLVILDTKAIDNSGDYKPTVDLDHVYLNQVSIDFFQLSDESRRKAYIEEMSYQLDLDKIKISDQSKARFSGKYSFPNQYNSISFSFLAKQWRSSFDVEYRYRLLGLDDKWSMATKDKIVSYWELPGFRTYQFEVQSRFKGGEWTDTKSFEFRVRGSIWLFLIPSFSIVLVVGLMYFFTRKVAQAKASKDISNSPGDSLKDHIKIDSSILSIIDNKFESFDSIEAHAVSVADKMKFFGSFNTKMKQLSKGSEKPHLHKVLEEELRVFSEIKVIRSNFIDDFERYYPDFELKIMANILDLSDREKDICRYIMSGLTNAQIAHILLMQADSVKKARQRLNKKINNTELELSAYLKNLNEEQAMV